MKTEGPITVIVKLTPRTWLSTMEKAAQDLQCNNLENEGLQFVIEEIHYLQSQRSITNGRS